MNEQIKEIMGKTLDKHFSHTWTVMDYEDVNVFAEKFAELIIQECADYIEHFYGDFVAKEIGGDIKRHFGVE